MLYDERILKVYAMRKLLFYSGIICLLLASLGLFGVLPVDLWTSIIDIFIERSERVFYKIVPSENAGIELIVLAAVGVSLILLSKLNLKRGNSN